MLPLKLIEESLEIPIGTSGCDVADAGGFALVQAFGSGWEDCCGKWQDRH
jgi:hypothetical protein